MNDVIYQRPDDYDLEHDEDDRDVHFYRELVRRLAPARVLELACGSGRLTIPLARLGALRGFDIVGVDSAEEMLGRARQKLADADDDVARRVRFVEGDMRTWTSTEPFDLVLIACSSITHLHGLEDQLALWRRAFEHLRPGGRFVVDVTMPNLRVYTESLQTPPRALLEVDVDSTDAESGRRLIRYKATSFDAYEQRARIHFFYDRFEDEAHARYVSDFESHVYFPRELQLLFLHTHFELDGVWADYRFQPPQSWSREIVMAGRRPA